MYNKQYYKDHKEQYRESDRKWRVKHPHYCNKYYKPEYHVTRYRKAKNLLFEILGGKICIKCRITDERCLQIDHINGGGKKEVREYGTMRAAVFKYIKDPELAKKKLQVLCANCNWIKRWENNECL